jgi:hypothetical protein
MAKGDSKVIIDEDDDDCDSDNDDNALSYDDLVAMVIKSVTNCAWRDQS